MQVDTFYPRHPLLKKHIEYYYFLKSHDEDFVTEYYSFPQTSQSLNIHKNATCQIDNLFINVQSTDGDKPLLVLQGKFEEPLLVQLYGKIDKVTIHFTPLGLNAFIKSPMCNVAAKQSQVFTEWVYDAAFSLFLQAFYASSNNHERVDILEHFLCLKYNKFNKEFVLQKAINMLHDIKSDYAIPHIAQSLGLTTRSFNRLFYKYMAISPTGYRKIAKFRHSLKYKLVTNPAKTFTEVCYESNFYDQAYFIKTYKKLTGSNPHNFFNTVNKLADNQLIFKFVKRPALS